MGSTSVPLKGVEVVVRPSFNATSRTRRSRSTGQSIVEFALIVPILLVIFVAVADLARIYTAMMTVESAAREAADYGAWNSSYWDGDPTDSASNYAKTVVQMRSRGCVASMSLNDYLGPNDSCANPAMTIALTEANGTPGTNCGDDTRTVPCRVSVTMDYTFRLLVPIRIDFFDVHIGFPPSFTFSRNAIFAISDFDIDTP